jgi:arylsulfatase A-like enzyme
MFTMKAIACHRCRRALLLALLSGVTLFGFCPHPRAELSFIFTNLPSANQPPRPNIILIVADGLGYGDLSCYGQARFQTPNLDRLAREGVRFTSYYAGDASSSPSRAALMLGRDSGHLKQRADADVPLGPDDVTIAQALKRYGYHTGLIGEWNLGNDGTAGAPWRKGFDEFAGYFDPNDATNKYADYIWRYAPRSIVNMTNRRREDFVGREMLYPNTGGKHDQYIPDLYAKAVVNFIKNNQADPYNQFRPFFLLVNFNLPGAGGGVVPSDAPYSSEPWPQPEKNKAAMITRLDNYIGQLLEQLQKLVVTNNTVIFFTSDTGPQGGGGVDLKFLGSTGSFRGGRGTLYEGGLRVPMIVWGPGLIPPGRPSDFIWAACDFFPTAADIARVQLPANLDGISILPTLTGKPQPQPRQFLFRWELRSRDTAQAARLGDWKIVRAKPDEKWELYQLKADPGETQNVADKHPEVIAAFEESLKNFDNPKSGRPVWPAQVSTNLNL